jgi:hypothetical protein
MDRVVAVGAIEKSINMNSFTYIPDTVFRDLKQYDWHNYQTQLAWIVEGRFEPPIIERISINEWNLHNDYYYFMDSLKEYHVFNLMKFHSIFKGVLFTRDVYNDPHFGIIEKFMKDNNKQIILMTGVKLDDI